MDTQVGSIDRACKVAITVPPFRPRLPWIGGDLQTLRNTLFARPADLGAYHGERLFFPMKDDSGDILSGVLHRPRAEAPGPLIVLVHGLAGCETSIYVLSLAQTLLGAGYPVLRLNQRGAGPSRADCREDFHGGRSGDLLAVAAQLRTSGWQRMIWIGFSLGGNTVLKLMGELGEDANDMGFIAAGAISTPLDLAATSRRMTEPRNWLYHRYVMQAMRRAVERDNGLTDAMRDGIARARTVWEFDDFYTAPAHGFGNAANFYRVNACGQFLPDIRVPSLIVHAKDDPWIPFDAYEAVNWHAHPCLVPAIAESGGHLGFHDRDGLWHQARVLDFLARLPA